MAESMEKGPPSTPDTSDSGSQEIPAANSAEVPRQAEAPSKLEPVKWRPITERPQHDSGQNAALEGRQFLMEKLFCEKSQEATSRRQQLMQEVNRRLLGEGGSTHASDRFSRMLDSDKQVLMRIVDDVGQTNQTFDELFDRVSDSPRHLRGIQMIGLSLLEDGFAGKRQKQLTELTEPQRRNVEVGQLLAMEASRRLAEMQLQRGKGMGSNQTRIMQERFEQLSQHAALPEKYQKQFAESSRKFAEKAEPSVAPKTVFARPASLEQRYQPRQDRAPEASPGQPGWVEVDVAAETGIYESLAKEFPESGTPEREQVDRFMQDFGEHIEYAQYVTDQKTVGDKITALVERIVHRPALHKKVFGWRGMVRSIVSPKAASRAMSQVRNQVVTALDKVAVQTHNFRYDRYGDILSAANDYENPKPLPHPERESADERIYTADEVGVPSAGTDEIIDVEWEPSREIHRLEGPPPLSEEEALFAEVEEWQKRNEDLQYEDWQAEVPIGVWKKFEQEARGRKMKPADLWKRRKNRWQRKAA